MAADFYSIRDVSTLLDEKYNTIAKRAIRLRDSDPDTKLLRSEADLDLGKDRTLISAALVDKWARKKAERNEPAGTRTDHDHMVAEREVLQQSLSHTTIALHHEQLSRRDAQIGELKSQIDQLENELAVSKGKIKALTEMMAVLAN